MARKPVIIGGGRGVNVAFYAGQTGFDPFIFTGCDVGGQIFSSSKVEDFPGSLDELENKGT